MRGTVTKLLILLLIIGIAFLLTLRAIPLSHIFFVCFSAIYAITANYFILHTQQNLPRAPLTPRSLSPTRNTARLLFPFTIILSISLPLILIALTSPSNTKPAPLHVVVVPHLFLMLCQILFESVGFLLQTFFTLYIRLGVTIAFVSYRIPVILQWYHAAVNLGQVQAALPDPSVLPPIAQATAVLNFVFWSFALLCFLLLYCLPAVCREPMLDEILDLKAA